MQLNIFHDFLELVMGLLPLLSSEVCLFCLHSPLLPVLCILNVRGRGAVVRWERGKTRRRMLKTYVTTTTFKHNSSLKKLFFKFLYNVKGYF